MEKQWWGATNKDGADPAGIPLNSYTAAGNGGRYVVVLPSVRGVIAIQPNEQTGQPPVPLYANVKAGPLAGLIRDFPAAVQPAFITAADHRLACARLRGLVWPDARSGAQPRGP